jgi:hypothetical protein
MPPFRIDLRSSSERTLAFLTIIIPSDKVSHFPDCILFKLYIKINHICIYIKSIMAKGSCMCGQVHYEYTVCPSFPTSPVSVSDHSLGRASSNSTLPLHGLPKMVRCRLHFEHSSASHQLQSDQRQSQGLRRQGRLGQD